MKELDDFERRAYEEEVLAEVEEEMRGSDLVRQRCRIVSFRSMSAGRGRKKRRPRWVDLLVVDDAYAYCIAGGEVKSRKTRDHHIAIDVLAKEILEDLPDDERTVDRLLERITKGR